MRKILIFLALTLSFSITSSLTSAQTNAPAGKTETGTGIPAGGGLAQQLAGRGLARAQGKVPAAVREVIGMALEIVTGTTTTTNTSPPGRP